MPDNQITVSYFSANDLFKSQYKKVLRWSLLVALLLTALGVWLMPSYQPNPYVLRNEFLPIINIELMEDIELPEIRNLQAPVILRNVEPVDDKFGEEDLYIDPGFWAPPAPPIRGGIEHLDQFTPLSSKPVLLHFAKPDYPEIARMSKLEGVVLIKALVGKGGNVEQTVVLQGVHPILDKAAAMAARRCRFKAGTQRTLPVKAWITIPYSFRLK